VLVSEVDGLRIIGNSSAQLLRRVADCLVDIFRIGATSPGATLLDARTLFDQEVRMLRFRIVILQFKEQKI
jgi:hypothetical protein